MNAVPEHAEPPGNGLGAVQARLAVAWNQMAARERRLVLVAVLLIGLALVWLTAVRPAWRTLNTTPAELNTLDLQLQEMQRLAAESRELRTLPVVPRSQAEAALRGATDRLGPHARLVLQGERATLTLSGVPGEALTAWLAEVRSAARARPDEAKLSRDAGGYRGTIVLSLPRAH